MRAPSRAVLTGFPGGVLSSNPFDRGRLDRTHGIMGVLSSRRSLARLASAALVALALPAGAAIEMPSGRGQIRGEVKGADGEVLTGISVVLSPISRPDVLYATSTDSTGRYALNGLVPDTYLIRADGQGYETVSKNGVRVNPPFRAITDFSMTPEAGPTGDGGADPGDAAGLIGAIEGVFLDAEIGPVMEGSVTLQRVGRPEEVYYAQTDSGGRFRITDVPAGRYNIKTRSPGLIPLHLVGRELQPVETLFLQLVAPDYPLSFKGWLEDLLPEEVPVPPPAPRCQTS